VNVTAIVVSYHPDVRHLGMLCSRLAAEGARVIVVDNSDQEFLAEIPVKDCELIRLGRNTGIAHAQNVGIKMAMSRNADIVALFDQDSEPEDGYLASLLLHLDSRKPGVVAPVCVDRATRQEMPSFRLDRLGWPHKVLAGGRQEPYSVDLVIASGSAASAVTFVEVGLMDEEFFIDFVDFEWCLRCRLRHVPITVVPLVAMSHSIGEILPKRRWRLGSKHSPARTYYKIRNGFLLFRKPGVPTVYALRAVALAIAHVTILLPWLENRRAYARILICGIRDGLYGVTGSNPASS